ncbi:MAG: hypothetical protein Q8L48_06025 [Archangium sp.]|nr:hypothetical protein [Archangium sp.]
MVVAVLATACTTKPVCTPGDTRACLGPGQCAGAQFCNETGSGFSACDCGGTGGGSGDAGSGGGNGGSDAGLRVRGAAQKGPFIVGSTVSVAALDSAGTQTGQVFLSQTSNDRGEFELTVPAQPLEFAELEASGFHFNEVTGTLSAAELSLRCLASLDGTPTYINVLTHLASNRIKSLAAPTADLPTARATAEQELRIALPIGAPAGGAVPASLLNLLGGDTDANAYLFAVSVVFAQAALIANPNAVDAELQQLLNTAALDFADGSFEPALITRLEAAERKVDVERVRASFRARLLEIGSSSTVPDLNRVLDTDGDGIANGADPCPLQAGNVPSDQFCMRNLELLEFIGPAGANDSLVGTSYGLSALVGATDAGGAARQVVLQWLRSDAGAGPLTPVTQLDGGRLDSTSPPVVLKTRDGSGEAIVGLINAGCATAAFASPAGVTKVVRFGCDASESPSVIQAPGGAMYALWRSNTPPFNSLWSAWSPGRSADFGAPALVCTECVPAIAASVTGAVAISTLDVGVPNGGQRLQRSDGDGGWSSPSIAPFASGPTITLDSRGTVRALFVTSSGSTLQLNWASHDGGAWSAVSPVTSTSVDPWPLLAGNGEGRAIAAFSTLGRVVGSALTTDGGGWETPRTLSTGAEFPTQALLNETMGVVGWAAWSEDTFSIAKYDVATGWGTSQLLPRVSASAQLSFVDDSTLRIVWRSIDGRSSTALLH